VSKTAWESHPEWAGIIFWMPDNQFMVYQLYPDYAWVEATQDFERVKGHHGAVEMRALPLRLEVCLSGIATPWDGRTRPPSRRYVQEERRLLEGLVVPPSSSLMTRLARPDSGSE
jgi:hypothetical protein